MADLSLVSLGSWVEANNAAVTPPLPASIVAGDTLIIGVGIREDGATFDTPSGWSLQGTGAFTGEIRISLYTRVYQTGDTAPTITPSGGGANDVVCGRMMAIRGDYTGVSVVFNSLVSAADGTFSVTSDMNAAEVLVAFMFAVNDGALPSFAYAGNPGQSARLSQPAYTTTTGSDATALFGAIKVSYATDTAVQAQQLIPYFDTGNAAAKAAIALRFARPDPLIYHHTAWSESFLTVGTDSDTAISATANIYHHTAWSESFLTVGTSGEFRLVEPFHHRSLGSLIVGMNSDVALLEKQVVEFHGVSSAWDSEAVVRTALDRKVLVATIGGVAFPMYQLSLRRTEGRSDLTLYVPGYRTTTIGATVLLKEVWTHGDVTGEVLIDTFTVTSCQPSQAKTIITAERTNQPVYGVTWEALGVSYESSNRLRMDVNWFVSAGDWCNETLIKSAVTTMGVKTVCFTEVSFDG